MRQNTAEHFHRATEGGDPLGEMLPALEEGGRTAQPPGAGGRQPVRIKTVRGNQQLRPGDDRGL
eukprot:1927000-Lingulodinium_polyedra.AAC.1